MKGSSFTRTALLLLAGVGLAGQTTPRPYSFIESRQGHHPSGPDTIGHKTVSQGDVVLCVMVEVYDASQQSSTACVVRFGDGPKHTLEIDESLTAPQDSEAYLECAGKIPRRCKVEVNPPPRAD